MSYFLLQVNFLLNGREVEELTSIVHFSKARHFGRNMCLKLQEAIPRQMFEIAIQATIGGKIIARENIKAYRKDVLAKCVCIQYMFIWMSLKQINFQ